MTKTCSTCADGIHSTLPCAEHILERVSWVEHGKTMDDYPCEHYTPRQEPKSLESEATLKAIDAYAAHNTFTFATWRDGYKCADEMKLTSIGVLNEAVNAAFEAGIQEEKARTDAVADIAIELYKQLLSAMFCGIKSPDNQEEIRKEYKDRLQAEGYEV